jgi:hypothetical protein
MSPYKGKRNMDDLTIQYFPFPPPRMGEERGKSKQKSLECKEFFD